MIAALLFAVFITLMLIGVPVGVALGLGGTVAIVLSNLDVSWFGLLAVPQNFYAGLAKYPLLAIPMFVLVGSIFDRSGVARRLVDFAVALVGRGPGMLPLVSIAVAMFLGGISGSGPACAAAVGAVMIAAMSRAGYPAPYSAAVVAAGAATDILIPPSVAFIIYSVLVPGARCRRCSPRAWCRASWPASRSSFLRSGWRATIAWAHAKRTCRARRCGPACARRPGAWPRRC